MRYKIIYIMYLASTDERFPNINSATASNEKSYGFIIDSILNILVMTSTSIGLICKLLIFGSVFIYLCSNDKRYFSSALKWFLIFVVACAFKGGLT